ncbi:DUF5677 domain-containing protein [Methanobacterium sp.]|uniref:DUF5677 domain-containing protein n=1 Tax=Methanobacterium sp. TaxID=2164 RepID=UPI002ABC0D74|nr:DUF5677 domain-containing protein [Methanobacterium sp.]MDY9924379.1 DUF5677 domain-containing protein [Methanobacterium sp.]
MNKQINKEYRHVMDEIQLDNIYYSLSKGDLNKIKDLHYAIHAFGSLPKSIINTESDFQSKSALLIYQHETYERVHESFISALSGHYNSAYTLLRNALELLIKGAFWECIAHKKYRMHLKSETRKGNATLRKFIDDLIEKEDSEIENKLEIISTYIYDVIDFYNLNGKEVYVPNISDIIDQLAEWNMFYPLKNEETHKIIYNDLYKSLSGSVHVEPDLTDIGRRVSSNGDELFKTSIILEELDRYLDVLSKLIDLSIVIELNILDDLIKNNLEVIEKLKKEKNFFKNSNLTFTFAKIKCCTFER